ncbi:hypothetical protein BC832DRAFT_588609 [Gaertneriomyces semiglobifer]|nr:hypothetical protein BC832DRAFT_588609 [Gaertneriomyces semiglobifer]
MSRRTSAKFDNTPPYGGQDRFRGGRRGGFARGAIARGGGRHNFEDGDPNQYGNASGRRIEVVGGQRGRGRGRGRGRHGPREHKREEELPVARANSTDEFKILTLEEIKQRKSQQQQEQDPQSNPSNTDLTAPEPMDIADAGQHSAAEEMVSEDEPATSMEEEMPSVPSASGGDEDVPLSQDLMQGDRLLPILNHKSYACCSPDSIRNNPPDDALDFEAGSDDEHALDRRPARRARSDTIDQLTTVEESQRAEDVLRSMPNAKRGVYPDANSQEKHLESSSSSLENSRTGSLGRAASSGVGGLVTGDKVDEYSPYPVHDYSQALPFADMHADTSVLQPSQTTADPDGIGHGPIKADDVRGNYSESSSHTDADKPVIESSADRVQDTIEPPPSMESGYGMHPDRLRAISSGHSEGHSSPGIKRFKDASSRSPSRETGNEYFNDNSRRKDAAFSPGRRNESHEDRRNAPDTRRGYVSNIHGSEATVDRSANRMVSGDRSHNHRRPDEILQRSDNRNYRPRENSDSRSLLRDLPPSDRYAQNGTGRMGYDSYRPSATSGAASASAFLSSRGHKDSTRSAPARRQEDRQILHDTSDSPANVLRNYPAQRPLDHTLGRRKYEESNLDVDDRPQSKRRKESTRDELAPRPADAPDDDFHEIEDLLDSDGPLADVITVLDTMSERGVVPSADLCRRIILESVKRRDFDKLRLVFNVLRDAIPDQLTRKDYLLLARGYAIFGDATRLRNAADDAKANSTPLRGDDYASLWKSLPSVKSPDVMRLLADGMAQDATTIDPATASQVLHDMIEANLTPEAYLSFKQFGIESDIAFDRRSTDELLRYFCSAKEYEYAYDVLQYVVGRQATFDADIAFALFSQCAKRSKTADRLSQIYTAIRDSVTLGPRDIPNLEVIFRGFLDNDQLEPAIMALDDMARLNLIPTQGHLLAQLFHATVPQEKLRTGFLDAFRRLLAHVDEINPLKVESEFIVDVIRCCLENSRVQDSLFFYRYMKINGIARPSGIFKYMFSALMSDNSLLKDPSAWHVILDARQSGYELTFEEASALVEGFRAAKQYKTACDFIDLLGRSSEELNVAFTSLFELYMRSKRYDEALRFFSSLDADELRDIHVTLMEQCVSDATADGRLDFVEAVMPSLRKAGHKIGRAAVHLAIKHIGTNPSAHMSAAIGLFHWGMESSAANLINPSRLIEGHIATDDCWSMLEAKLNILAHFECLHAIAHELPPSTIEYCWPKSFMIRCSKYLEDGTTKITEQEGVAKEIAYWLERGLTPALRFTSFDQDDEKGHNFVEVSGRDMRQWLEEVFPRNVAPNVLACAPELRNAGISERTLLGEELVKSHIPAVISRLLANQDKQLRRRSYDNAGAPLPSRPDGPRYPEAAKRTLGRPDGYDARGRTAVPDDRRRSGVDRSPPERYMPDQRPPPFKGGRGVRGARAPNDYRDRQSFSGR